MTYIEPSNSVALRQEITAIFADYSMRARQLIAAVRQGRKITVSILDEDPQTGYLAGWDADTYLLLVPFDEAVEKVLIPKGNILFIRLHDQGTFREEQHYPEMSKIVNPFRDSLNKMYPRP